MRRLHCFLASWLIAAGALHAQSGGKASALEALQALQSRMGQGACEVLVAMHGPRGQDQPDEWIVLTLNPQSPNLAQQFAIGPNGVIDEGAPPGLYPAETPPGFFDRSLVLIDSPYAFQLLHQVAVRARIVFNSVNFTLAAREYLKEPVWRLEAVDVQGRTVGQVDLSATSGAVYRSVWYYWEGVDAGSAWQGPRIVDSLLPEAFTGSVPQARPLEGPAGAPPLAGPGPARPPAAEPLRPTVSDPQEKDKGGLFSRLRRSSRPLFGSPAAPPAQPAPALEHAPEEGVAMPVPAGGAVTPTVEVAPAEPGGKAIPELPAAGTRAAVPR